MSRNSPIRKFTPPVVRPSQNRYAFRGPCAVPDRASARPDTGDDYVERAHRLRDSAGDLEAFSIESF